MSIRTVPRVAALLLAAVAAPAGAQEPRPVAPMPRPVTSQRFEVELKFPGAAERGYTAIQFQSLRDDVFALACGGDECQTRAPKDAVFVIGPGGLRRVMPMPEPPRFLVPATPIPTGSFVVSDAGAAKACEACSARPQVGVSGTWYREHAACVVAVTFAGDELTLKMTHYEGDYKVAATLTAHYALTKDGLIHGAITGADVTLVGDKTMKTEMVELSSALQELIDHPFSFRVKMTSAGLSVSHLKCSGLERDKKELLALCGLYTHAKDGTVPELKPPSPKATRCEECRPAAGVAVGVAIGAPAVPTDDKGQRIGVDFSLPMTLPVAPTILPPLPTPPAVITVPPPQPPVPQKVQPVGAAIPADAMKQMAAESFGEILREKGVTGQLWHSGMTLPSGRYLEHDPKYFYPDTVFPLPRELAAQDVWKTVDPCYPERYNHAASQAVVAPFAAQVPNGTHAAAPKHVGTWVREVGSKRCVLKVAADHFTLTVSEAQEVEGGKVVTGHLTFTVDYHLTRDGLTAVGLVTGVDVKFDGDAPAADGETVVGRIGELQKVLEDMPLALTLRTYPDALVVGSVRMPTVSRLMESEPTAYLGGRYRLMTEKALSPLKPVKAAPRPAYVPPPVPPGAYGVPPAGGYYLPSSGETAGDLLPPQQLGRPQPMRPMPAAPLPPIPTVEYAQGAALFKTAEDAPLPPIPAVESGPVTAVVPTSGVSIPDMPMPTPPARVMPTPVKPTLSDARPKHATEMAVAWRNTLTSRPDPTRPGETVVGITGQLFLYGGPDLRFVQPNGTLTVDLTDETPRPDGRSAGPQRWQFGADALAKLVTKDDTFGDSCTLFLPWPDAPSDVTRVRIAARYDIDGRMTLFQSPTNLALTRVMPTPKPPGAVVPVGATEDPNVRLQRKLYRREGENADLRQMQNEWRRFWFDDLPPDPLASASKSDAPIGRVQQLFDGSDVLRQVREELAARTPKQHPLVINFGAGLFGSR